MSLGKIIKLRKEAKNDFLKAVDIVYDIVSVTLGPKGGLVFIENDIGTPKITKDGVSVAKTINSLDKGVNVFIERLKSASVDTNNNVGDGTTTTVVLAHSLCKEAFKKICSGFDEIGLSSGVEYAINKLIMGIKLNSIDAHGKIKDIATISANNDQEIGEVVFKAIDKVGLYGLVTVEDGHSSKMSISFTNGFQFDSGYINSIFINDAREMCEFRSPMILVTDFKLSDMNFIQKLLQYVCVVMNKSLLLVCDDIDAGVLLNFIINQRKGVIRTCIVKLPSFGEERKSILEDLCIFSGAKFLSKDILSELGEFSPEMLGSCRQSVVSKSHTSIIDGAGSKESINLRVDMLKSEINILNKSTKENGAVKIRVTSQDNEKIEFLKSRISKLTSGAAIISVGGFSEIMVNEKKDRVIDSVNAVKSALIGGIVPGGGIAFVQLFKSFDKIMGDSGKFNPSFVAGMDIVKASLLSPTRCILRNADCNVEVILNTILDSDNSYFGFDALLNKFGNIAESGIVDPANVCKESLRNASSIVNDFLLVKGLVYQGKSNRFKKNNSSFNTEEYFDNDE